MAKKVVFAIFFLALVGLARLAASPAGAPLSKDDVSLLLLGSSPSSKIIQIVDQRGVDFQMNPDLAKKFHDQGASDDLIEALRKAGVSAAAAKASAPAPAASAPPTAPAAPEASPEASPEGKANAPGVAAPRAAEPPAPSTSAPPTPPSADEPVLHSRHSADADSGAAAKNPSRDETSPAKSQSSEPVLHQAPKAATPEATPEIPLTASAPGLKDPSPEEIQHIIQEFAAKEKIFRAARNNYTYHQINKVQELGQDNEVVGSYEQEWDILYDDTGKRVEKVTYAPVASLKGLIITKEDVEGFRSITPFVLTTDELPDYEIKYLGHVKVDEITAFVFSTRPKEIKKDRQYFQGLVWVDDRDYQIVKSQGKQVPQNKMKHGQENLFPRFTTWREQVDGKFWFPTYTMGDDTLYFSNGPPIHMKEIVRYTDYKQFKSASRILSVESIDKQKDQTNPPPATPQK